LREMHQQLVIHGAIGSSDSLDKPRSLSASSLCA
jgi:hypothetical protein